MVSDRFRAPARAGLNPAAAGPVAAICTFASEQEAVDLANSTRSGLVSYVYTESASRQWRMAEALESGMVGVNTGLVSTEVAPFGGVKESGCGQRAAPPVPRHPPGADPPSQVARAPAPESASTSRRSM